MDNLRSSDGKSYCPHYHLFLARRKNKPKQQEEKNPQTPKQNKKHQKTQNLGKWVVNPDKKLGRRKTYWTAGKTETHLDMNWGLSCLLYCWPLHMNAPFPIHDFLPTLHLHYVLLHHQRSVFLKWTESHLVSGSYQFQAITARNSSNHWMAHLQMSSGSHWNLCKIWLFLVWWSLLQLPARMAHAIDRFIMQHIRKVILWSVTVLVIKKYFIQSCHFKV